MDRDALDTAALRSALDAAALRAALVTPTGSWASVEVVSSTESTNADLVAAAHRGAADRSVRVAERQTAGRGRLDRRWTSPPGAGLTLSVLLRPAGVPADRLGWLPLLAGLSLLRVVRGLAEVRAVLKWPNDLLVGPEQAKAGGILVELAAGPDGPAAVVGIGLNVTSRADELPPGATSLALQLAACLDRGTLLGALLTQLVADEAAWRAAAGDPAAIGLHAAYRDSCATIGAAVRVQLPGAPDLVGTAVDVDESGRLVVRDELGALRMVAAGDVVHLRSLR